MSMDYIESSGRNRSGVRRAAPMGKSVRGRNTAERLTGPEPTTLRPVRIHPSAEMTETVARKAYRQRVLERLARHALRAGGAAQDIHNPCASVTANLSYLELRAGDLDARIAEVQDTHVGAQVRSICEDIREVARESGVAMRRIADVTRRLILVEHKSPDGAEGEGTELGALVRRAVRLLAPYTDGIPLTSRGETVDVTLKSGVVSELVLEVIIAGLEDGVAPSDRRRPCAVNIEISRQADGDSGARAIMKVTRRGPLGSPPRLDGVFAMANDIAQRHGGDINVHDTVGDAYVVTLAIPAK